MRQQSLFRNFTRYTFLSVLGTLGVSCYILADTFFISKGLGARGLTALNLAIPVYNFIHGTGLMLGMGGATKFTVCKAQGDQKETDRIFQNTIYLAVLFSALFFIVGLLFSNTLTALLGADESVFEMTETYLRWLLLFAPAFIMNDVFLCFVRNDDAPNLAMTGMLIGSLSNIVLDYLFIFPMRMGIFGAIFATGLSPIISIAMMSPHWLRKKHSFHFVKTGFSAKIAGQEISLGFPSLLGQISSGVVMITFNGIILGLEGNTGVAAYGVVANLSIVITAIYTGMAQGVQPLISDAYGQNHSGTIRLLLKYSMSAMLFVSIAAYTLLFVWADPVAAVFNSEGSMKLQEIAVNGLKLYFISAGFVGYNTILAIYFTSIEQPLPAHILSLLRGFFLLIPAAFLLSSIWQMTGVWLAYPIAEGLTAASGFFCYRHRQKSMSAKSPGA